MDRELHPTGMGEYSHCFTLHKYERVNTTELKVVRFDFHWNMEERKFHFKSDSRRSCPNERDANVMASTILYHPIIIRPWLH